MQISAADYPALKAFFAWMLEHVMPVTPGLPPEYHPVGVLTDFETRSMATARKGLALAIGDVMESMSGLDMGQVAAIDAALRVDGILTLTEVRARFWSEIQRIRRRGKVRNEEDYYALRNIVEALPDEEQSEVWGLLATYEEEAAR